MKKSLRLAAAIAFSLLVVANLGASAETKVIFTVDVESNRTFPLPKQVDTVCNNGSTCGLMEIVKMLKERGWAGTFFLSVYEYRMWGETAMRDIAVNLQVAGQDLALHTHPDMAYDPLRSNMYQYSLDEQVAIIRDGVRFLTSWTGRPVVAHRAGNYSADKRTLEALTRNGLRIDSSLFWEHPHCRLIDLGLPRNLPSLRGPLIEIPVTVYQREERPELFDNILAPVTSVRKIDADWFYDKDEAKAAIDGIVEADLPFLVIFLHSFSFIEGQRDGRVPVEDRHTRDIFGAILDRISQRRLKVVTMRDLAASEVVTATSQDQDVLPRVPVHTGLPRYLWHRQRVVGTGTLAIGVVVLFIIGTAVLIAVQRQRLTANAEDDRLGRDSRKVDREGH